MEILLDLVEPGVLIDYVRQWNNEVLRPEARWTLDEYLPNRETDDLEFRVRQGAFQDQDIAEFRAFDTQPGMADRQGVAEIRGSLGPVSRQVPLGEEEQLRLRSLLRGTDDPIINQIYDDAENMLRAVQGRIEVARGDIIDDGEVTIAENGLALSADFGRHADMSETAAILWSLPATATPITNLLAWTETYADHNGTDPDHILMSKRRIGQLALNQEFRDYAAINGTTPQRINRQTIDSILASEGLPPIRLNDEVVRKNKVRTRVLPEEKIYLMPPPGEPLGNTFYGVTAEALFLRERGVITDEQMPGLVAVVLQNQNPVQTYTLATGIALPAMPNPDLIMDIEVA